MKIIYKGNMYESDNKISVDPNDIISEHFKKANVNSGWNNPTWVIGPDENTEGAYFIYKENHYPYEIIRLYTKEGYEQHRKGDGISDFTETVYSSQSPDDIVQKANNIKNSFTQETALTEDGAPAAPAGASPIASTISTSDMPAFYGKKILSKRRV